MYVWHPEVCEGEGQEDVQHGLVVCVDPDETLKGDPFGAFEFKILSSSRDGGAKVQQRLDQRVVLVCNFPLHLLHCETLSHFVGENIANCEGLMTAVDAVAGEYEGIIAGKSAVNVAREMAEPRQEVGFLAGQPLGYIRGPVTKEVGERPEGEWLRMLGL